MFDPAVPILEISFKETIEKWSKYSHIYVLIEKYIKKQQQQKREIT